MTRTMLSSPDGRGGDRPAGSSPPIGVELKGGEVVTDMGLCIVGDVCAGACASDATSRDGALVLGFEATGAPTACADFLLGKLYFERFVVCARCKLWWMTPEWGDRTQQLPPETQFMLAELQEGGPYVVLLPLIDRNHFRATIRPPRAPHFGQDQELIVRVENGDATVKEDKWENCLYIAAGWNPFELVDQGVATAAAISGTAKVRRKKCIPDSLDAFGWCTWDAFYSRVSARGVVEGVTSLCKGNTPPRLLIIDDGWQQTDADPWLRASSSGKSSGKSELVNPPAAAGGPDSLVVPPERKGIGESGEVDGERSPCMAATADGKIDVAIDDKAERRNCWQRFVAWFMGILQGLIVFLYLKIIDPAPPGSLRVRAFTALANGPLKYTLLKFYAAAGDFSRRLVSVKANGKFSSPFAGPEHHAFGHEERLADVVAHLRQHLGVQHIYCWHGLPAYWSGVMPEAKDVAKYGAKIAYAKPGGTLLELEPSLAWNPSVLAGVGVVDRPEELYNDMHSYLSEAGIDGVKVDCQAGVGLLGSSLGGGPALSKKFHSALESSVTKYFPGNHCINCMCHSTENIYRFENTAVARASDDFYPTNPASITPHIAASAYNSLFLSPLVVPDWDMFHSEHTGADLHAAARAVSGGPVYVSDKPDTHNFAVLQQLVLANGSILRAQDPGRPTRDCLFRNVLKDKKTLLKVWTTNPCSGVVGVFNLQGASWDRTIRQFCTHDSNPSTLQARVSPDDIDTLPARAAASPDFNGQYAAYSFRGRQLRVSGPGLCVPVRLEALGSEVVSVAPVLEAQGVGFCPMGLSGMLNGSAAVRQCRTMLGNGAERRPVEFEVDVLGAGEFLMYASRSPSAVWFGDRPVAFDYEPQPGAVRVALPETSQPLNCLRVAFSLEADR